MMRNKLLHILIILTATILSQGAIHLINLHHLKGEHPQVIREGIAIRTADDASYLRPPINYLETGRWNTNDPGVQSYFIRPPGYGLIWMTMMVLAGKEKALFLLIAFQVLMHALATVCVFVIMKHYLKSSVALTSALLYGCLPTFGGFLFYTLTESFTPALVVFYIFALWKYHLSARKNDEWFWLSVTVVIFGFLFITRPVLGVFILPLTWVLLVKRTLHFWNRISRIVIVLFFAFLPMLVWQVRNYQLADEWVGLHPIYHETTPGIFRPAHQSIWQFCKSWGMEGHQFHAMIQPLFNHAVMGDTSYIHRRNALKYIPDKVIRATGEKSVLKAFGQYQKSSLMQGRITENFTQPMPDTLTPAEKNTIQAFHALKREYRAQRPLDSYVIAPVKVLGVMLFHSNLNLYVFQKTWRGSAIMEGFRFFSFVLHSLVFLLLIPAGWILRKNPFLLSLLVTIMLYLGYLAWVQRGVEERYTLPVLGVGFVLVVIALLSGGKGKVFGVWRKEMEGD